MEVFLSWSGSQSKALAECIKDLFPDLLHNIHIWMSEHDLQAGMRWSSELSERLSRSDVGIACVTPSNQHSPWLMFEAGAISKSLIEGRLIPFLLGIGPEQIDYPLAQFQMRESDKNGTFKLICDLNSYTIQPVDDARLSRLFDRWWPDFSEALKSISKQVEEPKTLPMRSDKDILYEILERVRALPKIIRPRSYEPKEIVELHGVIVDTRPLLGNKGKVLNYKSALHMTVADFLDNIWGDIQYDGNIPPYTYGDTWVIHSTVLNISFNELGSAYIRTRGLERDLRSLEEVGIPAGDFLQVRGVRL